MISNADLVKNKKFETTIKKINPLEFERKNPKEKFIELFKTSVFNSKPMKINLKKKIDFHLIIIT